MVERVKKFLRYPDSAGRGRPLEATVETDRHATG
jgi:hypothetical protein